MHLILEVIRKQKDSSDLVYVVRSADGFPLCVRDSLADASDYIRYEIDRVLKVKVTSSIESNSSK